MLLPPLISINLPCPLVSSHITPKLLLSSQTAWLNWMEARGERLIIFIYGITKKTSTNPNFFFFYIRPWVVWVLATWLTNKHPIMMCIPPALNFLFRWCVSAFYSTKWNIMIYKMYRQTLLVCYAVVIIWLIYYLDYYDVPQKHIKIEGYFMKEWMAAVNWLDSDTGCDGQESYEPNNLFNVFSFHSILQIGSLICVPLSNFTLRLHYSASRKLHENISFHFSLLCAEVECTDKQLFLLSEREMF